MLLEAPKEDMRAFRRVLDITLQRWKVNVHNILLSFQGDPKEEIRSVMKINYKICRKLNLEKSNLVQIQKYITYYRYIVQLISLLISIYVYQPSFYI